MDFLFQQNLTDDTTYFRELFEKCGIGAICWQLAISSSLRWMLTLFGLFANSALILVTFRNKKKFNGTTNRLLAFGAFFEFCYLLCYSIPFILAITGRNFIPLRDCFFLISISIFGAMSSMLISFFVGLDRLFSVLFPLKLKHEFAFLLLSLSLIFAYSAYILVYGFLIVSQNPQLPAVCGITEVYFPRQIQIGLVRNNLLINLATLLLYLILWVALRRQLRHSPSITENVRTTKRIFNAILAIMLAILSMWLLTMLLFVFLGQIANNTFQWFIFPVLTSSLKIVAASSNPPLLYIFNLDYKEAIKREIKMCAKWAAKRIGRQRQQPIVETIANGTSVQRRR